MKQQPRIRPKVGILAAFVAGSVGGRGVVGDLSRGGFFIWTPVLAPPGTRIHITLREPGNREIDVRGEVRWNVGRFVQGPGDASGFGVMLRSYSIQYGTLVTRIAAEYAESHKD